MLTTGYAVTAILNVKHCIRHQEYIYIYIYIYIYPGTIVLKF